MMSAAAYAANGQRSNSRMAAALAALVLPPRSAPRRRRDPDDDARRLHGTARSRLPWSRAELTAGLIIQALVGLVSQPLVGRMIDRRGPRRIGLAGLAACGCAFALFSAMDGSVVMWLLMRFWFRLRFS